MANNDNEGPASLPNFSIAFQQMANFVAIAKTRNSDEILDEVIQQCFVVLPGEPFSSPTGIAEAINVVFGIRLVEKDISSSMQRLFDKKKLILLPGGQIGLAPAVKKSLEDRISEAKSLEESVKKVWLSQVSIKYPNLNPEKLWESLKAYLALAFRRHGIQVITLFDPTAEVVKEQMDSLSSALGSVIKKNFNGSNFNNAHDMISSFFATVSEDRNRAEYISQLADGAFNYFSLTVPPEVCEKLRTKLSPLMLFLDTNFIFGILNLQSNSQFDVSTELVQAVKKFKLPFRLYYHEATQREASDTLTLIGQDLRKNKWPQQISRAAMVRPEAFSSVERRYHRKNAEKAIEVEDFLSPYKHWEILLKEQGMDIYHVTPSADRLLRRADLEAEYKDFLLRVGHEKKHDAIQHDMAVLETVRSLRLNVKDTLSAGAVFITCDFFLSRFDWENSRKEGKPRCTVFPSHLWQILRPFVTENQAFDQAFAETFALPEFTLMKGGAMRAASRMISILASYKDFPEEAAVKMLTNDLLLTELQNKKTDEEFSVAVDSAFAKEIASLSSEISILKKQLATETGEKEAISRDVSATQKKLEELQKELLNIKEVETLKQKECQAKAVVKEPKKRESEKDYLKRDSCIIAVLAAIIFELLIHVFKWSWFLNHVNSYGLQVAFSLMFIFGILGLMVSSWRKFCWFVGGLSILAVIIQLLGGPTKS